MFTLLDGAILAAVSPAWKGENKMSVGLANTLSFFRSKDSLVSENMALRDRLADVEAEAVSLRAAAEREVALLSIFGREPNTSYVAASVLARPPETPYDMLVIDAGLSTGVREGSAVMLPEGARIGSVSEVFSGSAKVRLYTTGGEKTNAVLERHGVPVILTGAGGGNFKLALPRDTEIMPGDRILSASINAELVGVVEHVALSPTDAFKEVLVRGPLNVFKMRYVLVSHEE